MKDQSRMILMVICCMVLLFSVGCQKKVEVEPEPYEPPQVYVPEEEVEPEDDYDEEAERLAEEQRLVAEKQAAVATITENKIFFDFDSFELKTDARAVLQTKAELLKKYPEFTMTIEGHCDERGTDEYNLALGQKRAQAALEFLVLLGVDVSRLNAISFGEERPADPGHNEDAWSKNRRDEFRLQM